jgi:threonine/homoserine/homoserine lactone efflux protein
MIPEIGLFLTALGLGLAYAAAPGAVNTEALRRGIAHGARAAFLIESGSLIGDTLWAALALTGVAVLARHLAVQIVLGIAGGCFLLRMGWLALHAAFTTREPDATAALSRRGDFGTGVVFGLANPVGLAFWTGLGGSVVAAGATGIAFVAFFLGFFCGAALWCLSVSLLIHHGRRWIHPNVFRWISALCGLALGYFGARALWGAVSAWLERQFVTWFTPGHQPT